MQWLKSSVHHGRATFVNEGQSQYATSLNYTYLLTLNWEPRKVKSLVKVIIIPNKRKCNIVIMLQVCEEKTGFPFNSDYPENVIKKCIHSIPSSRFPCHFSCMKRHRQSLPSRVCDLKEKPGTWDAHNVLGERVQTQGGPLVQTTRGSCDSGHRLWGAPHTPHLRRRFGTGVSAQE